MHLKFESQQRPAGDRIFWTPRLQTEYRASEIDRNELLAYVDETE